MKSEKNTISFWQNFVDKIKGKAYAIVGEMQFVITITNVNYIVLC